MKYLDFQEVSRKLDWFQVLDWLNIPYEEKGREIRTEDIVISKQNKLYFNKKEGTQKGKALGIINFVAEQKHLGLRRTCELLIDVFLKEHQSPERNIPELALHYTNEVKALGITEETAREYQVGMVKQRSIMAGKVAFKLPTGYIGKEVKKDGWFYPKGFHRDFLYNEANVTGDYCILVPGALDCVLLCQMGFLYTIALLALTPTPDQLYHLTKYRRILLIHPAPDATLLKLASFAFVKSVPAPISKDTSVEQIKNLFK